MNTTFFEELKKTEEVVQILKKSESQLVVKSFKHIKDKISDKFKFRAPNYFFHPLYRKKLWDGYVKLYNKSTGTLHAGLFKKLVNLAKEEGYKIRISKEDAQSYLPDYSISLEDVKSFIFTLKLPEYIKVRNDQIDGVFKALSRRRCVLLSPTSSGKSLIIYLIIRYILSKNPNVKSIAVVVISSNLVEQMHKDFIEYATLDDSFNVDAECHKIYAGKSKSVKC